MRRLTVKLAKPAARFTEAGIRNKIAPCLSGAIVSDLVRYQLEQRDGRWHLQFDPDHVALEHLLARRLGRTTLLTNRMDWSAEQVVAGYSGQQQIERVFRGLKEGDWLGWGPMVSLDRPKDPRPCLLLHVGDLAAAVHLQESPSRLGWAIQQFALLYPPQSEKGLNRVALVLSKQTVK